MKDPSSSGSGTDSHSGNNGETVLTGRAVSRGVRAGKVLCLHGKRRQFFKGSIADTAVSGELERFREAVGAARAQLEEIAGQSGRHAGPNQAKIFETHRLFLEDRSLLKQIESTIRDEKVNAEWAVKQVTDKYVERYKSLTDKHLQEKYIDLEDVAERLLGSLGVDAGDPPGFEGDTVIVARELNPSTMIELGKAGPAAVVTENGGWTSHTFILAREMNVPAVTGIKQVLRIVESGDRVLVDGFNGRVVLNPSRETLEHSEPDAGPNSPAAVTPRREEASSETLDGKKITLLANVDVNPDYEDAENAGAAGIGLFRSEFIFNQHRGFPSEEEQYVKYREIADRAGDHCVRIRTFDLSVGQVTAEISKNEKNPALGLRGIRLSMAYEKEFRKQIRAILRAAANGNVDVILPMISDVNEIRWAKDLIADESHQLEKAGIETGDPEIGAMVEIPAAVFTIGKILEEVNFVNIGTNDLIQYLLAVDRDNEEVADWFNTLHPSVLSSLKTVIDASASASKPAIVCGEMAGSPLYVPLLIALGAECLSMNVRSIARIRHLVSSIAYEECVEAYKEISELRSDGEIDDLVYRIYHEKWANLADFENLVAFRRRIEDGRSS